MSSKIDRIWPELSACEQCGALDTVSPCHACTEDTSCGECGREVPDDWRVKPGAGPWICGMCLEHGAHDAGRKEVFKHFLPLLPRIIPSDRRWVRATDIRAGHRIVTGMDSGWYGYLQTTLVVREVKSVQPDSLPPFPGEVPTETVSLDTMCGYQDYKYLEDVEDPSPDSRFPVERYTHWEVTDLNPGVYIAEDGVELR